MGTPYPKQDNERQGRVVADVLDRLHVPSPSDKDTARVEKWISATLYFAARNRRLWFLEHLAAAALPQGADVIDFSGQIDKVTAAFAPKRLDPVSLQEIAGLRAEAQACARPNAGRPRLYALEAGKRLHLWPAPYAVSPETPLTLTFTVPPDVSLLPDEWEHILSDGAIGLYGRHWDKAQLIDDADEIEARFLQALKDQRNPSLDAMVHDPWKPGRHRLQEGTVTPQSAAGTATGVVVPASLTGIGYVEIQVGPYPLEVE